MTADVPTARVGSPILVVGTGLIGTSVALGLRRLGADVLLHDTSPTALALARDRGAGRVAGPGASAPRLVVVAVPPDVVAREVAAALEAYPQSVVTDVASVKVPVVAAVGRHPGGPRYVGGHPMAGRERSGPLAARGDLFDGRPWVLTPTGTTSRAAVGAVRELVEDLGAVVVTMSPAEHDDAVALVSHLPQVAASLVAARLRDAGDRALALCGQGVRDVTRIAASDPVLWAQILGANAGPVRRTLGLLREDLDRLLEALSGLDGTDPVGPGPGDPQRRPAEVGAWAVLAGAVRDGNDGQRLIPGKHGGGLVQYAVVGVVVEDRPGEIARLLAEIGEIGVNIEDIRIEHSLGRPTGLVEIAVAPSAVDAVGAHLDGHGWTVVP